MQHKDHGKKTNHLLALPSDVLFYILSFLNDDNLNSLKRVFNHRLNEYLIAYNSCQLYFQNKIFDLCKELDLLIDSEKILYGINSIEEYQSLHKLLLFLKKVVDIRNIRTNVAFIHDSIKNLARSIPSNPIVLLYKDLYESKVIPMQKSTQVASYLKHTQSPAVGQQQILQFLNQMRNQVTKQAPSQNPIPTPSDNESTIKDWIPLIRNHFDAGNKAIYFILIHIGLSHFKSTTPNNSHGNKTTIKVDCSFLKDFPFITTNFTSQSNSINAFVFINYMLSQMGLASFEFPAKAFKKKGKQKKVFESNCTQLASFLIKLNWIDLFCFHPKKAIESLRTIYTFFEENEIKVNHIDLLNIFHNSYHLPWGSETLNFCLKHQVSSASTVLDLLYSSIGKLVLEKLSESENIPKAIQFITHPLVLFNLREHPKLIHQILEYMSKNQIVELTPIAKNLLQISHNICWSLEDINLFLKEDSDPEMLKQKSLTKKHKPKDSQITKKIDFLKKIPAILSYWNREEVENFYTYNQKITLNNADDTLSNLIKCTHNYLIFKRFTKSKDLALLMEESIPYLGREESFLNLLCNHFSKVVCNWLLIENETATQLMQYIKNNIEYLQLIHAFLNVDRFFELTGNAFHPKHIKKINLEELNVKLEIFNSLRQQGHNVQDCLSLTFSNNDKDLEALSFILKNEFCNQYIKYYQIPFDFIISNFNFFELLGTKITSASFKYLLKLEPNYLMQLNNKSCLVPILQANDPSIIEWLFFSDWDNSVVRSLDQIAILLESGLFRHEEFFVEFNSNIHKVWYKHCWFGSFLYKVKDAELVIKLLTSNHFDQNNSSLEFIGKQGEMVFNKVMTERSNENSVSLIYLKEWYSKPWLKQIASLPAYSSIFIILSLSEIEQLANDKELFSFLLSNPKLHTKISKLRNVDSVSYLSLLKIFQNVRVEDWGNLLILIQQYSVADCILLYRSDRDLLSQLLTTNKWDLIKDIAVNKTISTFIDGRKRKAELENQDSNSSKRQKINNEIKDQDLKSKESETYSLEFKF